MKTLHERSVVVIQMMKWKVTDDLETVDRWNSKYDDNFSV